MKDWRYQWSSKLDNGEIYVVHADSRDELEDEIIYVKSLTTNWKAPDITEQNKIIQKANEEFEDEGSAGGSRQFFDDDQCKVHNIQMKERVGKDGKKFYSHSRGKYPDLEWCSGHGFPDEK